MLLETMEFFVLLVVEAHVLNTGQGE